MNLLDQITSLIKSNAPEEASRKILELDEIRKALKVAALLGGQMKGGR